MIEEDKKLFAGWWLWVALLVGITVVGGFGLRLAGVAGERVVFENSYQRSSADDARQQTLRAELVSIEARLGSGGLSESERADLEANAAGIRHQLNRTGE